MYLPTYLPTYPPIIYLPIHALTYLILSLGVTMRFNHYVWPLDLTIKFSQISTINFNLNLTTNFSHYV
jgi:hypothetical protein